MKHRDHTELKAFLEGTIKQNRTESNFMFQKYLVV